MDLGVHLPLMQFGDERLSRPRLERVVDTARDCGFAAVAANDHFVFPTPWLDGPTALASMIERSGRMTLATTVSLAVLRGPVQLAKGLAPLDILSEGRLVAAIGPGSAERDYNVLGIPFEERCDPDDLREQVCVGPAKQCAELLSRYADAGCQRVYLWPLGDEPRQLELVAGEVAPQFVRA